MREIKLYLEKTDYRAGETISGTVEVICDKDFGFNEMYVEFNGKEHTWVTKQVGKHTHTYKEEYFHINERFEIMPPGEMQYGEIRVPFSFQIPADTPNWYKGIRGHIEYTLEGKIELSWARDPKHRIDLNITGPSEVITPSSVSGNELDNGVPQLDAELENNEIYPGDIVRVKYRVERQDKMRGVRFDVETTERVTAQGFDSKNWKRYSEVFIEEDNILLGSWRSLEIPTPKDLPVTYEGPLVSLETNVKIVIDIPWGLDKDVTFPLIVRKRKEGSSDMFDDYSSDQFGF
ncbi:MAG: sporulation protein [Candidatus Thorarchaeota archaeon]|nr:sporulation protein [Candidatus Thorarchaeota archaeon]